VVSGEEEANSDHDDGGENRGNAEGDVDDDEEDVNIADGGSADDEDEMEEEVAANIKDKSSEEGDIREGNSDGQTESNASSDVNVPTSHLMPPPPAPVLPKHSATEELPDVSPIPVAVPGVAYETPVLVGIKR
jgi:hypothetical protein